MLKTKEKRKPTRSGPAGTLQEVLTLAETAAYLRLPEGEAVRLVDEQGLPGRQVADDW